jgi:nucleoporin NDC1
MLRMVCLLSRSLLCFLRLIFGIGLKEGVARIVRTFGDKLLAFKFPPRTARKLQGFLEYC